MADNHPLTMVRDTLDDIVQHPLPTGYRFRQFNAGDEQTWTRIQRAAEPLITVTDELFANQFGSRPEALPSRMVFIETEGGEAIGTTTAWWENEGRNPARQSEPGRGRIHWVAVHPDHQRRGLSKPLVAHALKRLAQDHESAMLDTSSSRAWALKVYLDLGFRPDPAELTDPACRRAWQGVQQQLEHPGLASYIAV